MEQNTLSPAISVIVPVYKVEAYLPQCVESILNQTFSDFELILVDDGSPDNCGAICDEYAAKDSRIRVIHQKNAGVSAARNVGLDWVFANSNSPWITFVDSDDMLIPTCLAHLYQYAQQENGDITATYGQIFTNDIELVQAPSHVISYQILSGKEACIHFYQESEVVSAFPWGKLYRRALFTDFRFPVGKVYEDEALVPKLLYTAGKVVVLRSWLYGYRQRQDSIVHIPFSPQRFDHLTAIDSCMSFFEERGAYEIADLVRVRKQKYQAKYMLLAHGARLKKAMPDEYRMSLIKAFCIMVTDSARNGGIKYLRTRIRNFFSRTQKQ